MEQLLNSDGTPSFTNISDLRTNFEESFARKQLGATMKSIVIKCINHIENNNAAEVLSDEKIRGIVKGSIEDVADKCFTNDELNGSSYIGGLKRIVKEYAGMEAAYREDLANAILATESDKAVAGGKILELFSTENLKFTDRNLFKRYSDELESTFALEGEEIVTEIGKEVGAVIAEAEEKNVIINETSKVIQDKQNEIREELATTDENDDEKEEGKDTSSDNEEFNDSEDDGEEQPDDDGTNDDETTSTEGLEDFDTEITTIEENLDTSLISDIENGKITIGVPDTTHTEDTDGEANVAVADVSEHTDDGAVGNETPDQVPTDLTVSTPNEGEEPETNDTVSIEGYGTKEYLDHKFGNENLGKVIVPLSPTKLDMIDILKTNALACVYAKGSEGLDSLRSVVTARFDILEDIVNREHDEELTKKFDEYKKFAIESFDGAVDIQNSMAAIGITPYGLIDKEDPVSLYIGSKAHRYLSHNLSIKNEYPKKSFESLNDAIDAAFDIAILKDAARNSKSKDDLIVLNKERASREDLFWNNIVGLDGDEEKKDQIKNILQFADLDIDTKALVDTEYLNSINIALDTQKIPVPGKCENEIHEELFNSAKERIESFLGKDIDGSQIDIIRAMIEGRDTSDYAPTTFEKFIIKLGTDEALEKNGGKDFEVGQESAELIKNKAIILTALNAFVDKVKPMNEYDTKEFKEYIGL